MAIVITGASGFVGRNIIPELKKAGEQLLLVGRNVEQLRKQYPYAEVTSYDQFSSAARGYDTLVHLAVLNNNKDGSLEQFRKVNVELLKNVVDQAILAGVKTLIYTSTLLADNSANSSHYVQSKREADEFLQKVNGLAVVKLKLPSVYGATFAGKLRVLNKIPGLLRPAAFDVLASFKPTVRADCVAQAILVFAGTRENSEQILSDKQFGNFFYAFINRSMDLVFAGTIIVFFWWFLLLVWLVVKITSPGPGILSQVRVGKDEKHIVLYKFRTMKEGTKQLASHEIGKASITKTGHILRKTKIDELPQVLNILKNEMSLVGPRPCLPVQEELIAARKKRGILNIKCGITGLAQVQGVDMENVERLVGIEEEYIARRTLLLDIKIILATAIGSGQGDRVR